MSASRGSLGAGSSCSACSSRQRRGDVLRRRFNPVRIHLTPYGVDQPTGVTQRALSIPLRARIHFATISSA